MSALTPRLLSEVPKLCVRSTSHHMLRRYACPPVVSSAGRKAGSLLPCDVCCERCSDVSQAVNSHFSRFAIAKLACAQVFELTREQERTKQAEASKEEAQYKVYAEQQRKVRLCQVTAMLTVMHVVSFIQCSRCAVTWQAVVSFIQCSRCAVTWQAMVYVVHSNCVLYRKLKRQGGRSSARPCSRMRKPRHSWPSTRMSLLANVVSQSIRRTGSETGS